MLSVISKKNVKPDFPKIIYKNWGKELIFADTEQYSGKILHLYKDKQFSLHYHIKREETWYVSKGKLILHWIDHDNGIINTEDLNVGDIIIHKPGEAHKLHALEDSEIFEVGTKDYPEDTFRILKGD
jgi:mannose-6-phosphate isomerase-like protein (cupin superfamily)